MNQDAFRQLQKARANMIIDHPFFGTLALRLRLEEAPIKTLAVDGKTIFYNPEFVLGMSLEVTKAAVAHEVMHCVLDHLTRREGRNPHKWNRACDFALNPILKDAGFTLGESWLYNAGWVGKSADEIYSMLPDGGAGGGSEDGPDGADNGLCDVRFPAGEPGEVDSESAKAAAEEAALDWKMATAQAAHEALKQGKLPGSLKRFVDEALGYTVHYREILWRFATEVSKNDYSWSRPSRRWLSAGAYLPSLHSEQMGEMVVVVDTSGSIGDATLSSFAGEISALRSALIPQRLHVVYCDARVQKVDTFEPGDPFSIEAPGGGGTDFRPPFRWLDKHGIHPACLVYLTDMHGTFPDAPPPYPVLWCATSDEVAPFGETARVRE